MEPVPDFASVDSNSVAESDQATPAAIRGMPPEIAAKLINHQGRATVLSALLSTDDDAHHEMCQAVECLMNDGANADGWLKWKDTCRNRYLATLSTPERLAKHADIMQEFIGDGSIPAPPPFHEGIPDCNPAFSLMWEPWARDVQYTDAFDTDLCVGGGRGAEMGMIHRHNCTVMFTWAVPTLPLLKFMVDNAPNHKIADIGSGHGYWSALLSHMGADVMAVDDGSELDDRKPVWFPDTVIGDAVEWVHGGSADDRALLFCWARPGDMPARCIEAYKGDTVFFVGENGEDQVTFGMDDWLESEEGKDWKLEAAMNIPCWPGVHDWFAMCKRVQRE